MLTQSRFRASAAIAAVAFALSACGDGESLPTTLDTAATNADVSAMQAVFETPQLESFSTVGYQIDMALGGFNGAIVRAPVAMLREGPERPLQVHRERLVEIASAGDDAAAIPVTALGKTYVWSTASSEYVVSARTGAPGNGVRFILYQIDEMEYAPAVPLVEVGYVDITQGSNTATVAAFTTTNAKVMEYTARIGGTSFAPSLSLKGFAGTGASLINFELGFAVSLSSSTVTTTWRTEMPSRGISSRVQLAMGESSITIGALMRAGNRKVEMGGSIGENGGTITVRVGGKVFARININGFDGVSITNATGGPLTPAEEETLENILAWFEVAFGAPDALLTPIYTVLDIPGF